ncbi:MAG: glycoside hydrolase family 10 protein [Candidatus Cyclobacteriaceae bacterium M3_2C_046]
MNIIIKWGVILLVTFWLAGCARQAIPLKREFRAVWMATVSNIDWPSSPHLSSSDQKGEFRYLLDYHKMNGFNAIILQIRPAADAFYYSEVEPWSVWLTGETGSPPQPYYDPLHYMIEETHDRGMEFHAWFNPYRAAVSADILPEDSGNIVYQHPEWFLQYGDRLYFDPGIPAVRAYVTRIVMDVVNRYDIDAVHFDDYFYPYKISGEDFPDSISFARYGYAFSSKADWRRYNVDRMVQMLSDSIKKVDPLVKFGISPFGVWRNQSQDPTGSATQAGQTNYDDLYADVIKWLSQGWIDYVIPQLYWNIGFAPADYQELAGWWSKHHYDKHLYIGHGAYKIDPNSKIPGWREPGQIPAQLRINRKSKVIKGSAYFSSKSLVNNPLGISDILRTDFYRYPALIPLMPWIDQEAPAPPRQLTVMEDVQGVKLGWQPGSGNDQVRYYLIYRFKKSEKVNLNDPRHILAQVRAPITFFIDPDQCKCKYVVTALDRLYNESTGSEPVEIISP